MEQLNGGDPPLPHKQSNTMKEITGFIHCQSLFKQFVLLETKKFAIMHFDGVMFHEMYFKVMKHSLEINNLLLSVLRGRRFAKVNVGQMILIHCWVITILCIYGLNIDTKTVNNLDFHHGVGKK